jgi:pyruvate-formate lyase-activating enzyme
LNDKIEKIKNAPNGFCLAKWYQVTIDLISGHTHSCHHPDKHKIPLEELNESPMALHNTEYKMLQRKKMLEGIRPDECVYCWNIEDISKDLISDRFIKSTDSWAFEKLDETLTLPWNTMVSPTYLEVVFSSDCNLNCSYCVADLSSSIKREMITFGPYPIKTKPRRDITLNDNLAEQKKYLDAFWKFLPMVSSELRVFRITGGEPLLSKDTFKVLEFFENNPNPNLELAINSNLSYSKELCEKLLSYLKVLLAKKCIKKCTLFVSIDTSGEQAEYTRKGLSEKKFMDNVNTISNSLPDLEIVIMCTYNIFSIFQFSKLLRWIEQKKEENCNVTLDVSYLLRPEYLRANIIDHGNLHYVHDSLKIMKESSYFTNYEVGKFERVVKWIESTNSSDERNIYRSDFYSFVNEYDRRFEMNFLDIFPEASGFYQICKKTSIIENLK